MVGEGEIVCWGMERKGCVCVDNMSLCNNQQRDTRLMCTVRGM